MEKNILILGAGKVGAAIADMLASSGDYRVTLSDVDEVTLARLDAGSGIGTPGIATSVIDVADRAALAAGMSRHDSVLSALPYHLNRDVAAVAADQGLDYFDLTEDVATTRAVRALAEGADTAFAPQCGLAPGFISIVANDLCRRFDQPLDVRMRVGALPIHPDNRLKYNLTWNTEGLINEYLHPCDAIHNGRLTELLPLEGVEHFTLDGMTYEAFNTSGGLGSLCETLQGAVRNLSYKSIRYPGHRDAMKLLIDDLGLGGRPDLLREVMEAGVPSTTQDVVLVFVTVTGMRDGRLMQEGFARKIYGRNINGRHLSAIQLTTSAGVCAVIDLHAAGRLPRGGYLRPEQVALEDFLANRFGRLYSDAGVDIAPDRATAA